MTAWDEVPNDLGDMRRKALFETFTPAAPIDRNEVFAGRRAQLYALGEVIFQKGQHAVIYGERGVGKTSLAKVARERASGDRMFSAHVTCDSGDTFASIWAKVLGEVRIVREIEGEEVEGSAADYLTSPEPTPNDIRVVLRELTKDTPAVVFVDEFDVIADDATRRAMAETIKVLSDQGINATVVLVGVAESVTDLISEHASTERNLTQVPMPRMDIAERLEIITKGLEKVEMTIAPELATRIALMSQGLGQFVHLLTQRAAIIALNAGRDAIEQSDLDTAIQVAIEDTHVSVSSSYYAATKSNQETLYPNVVLACALVEPDERGFFQARLLEEPMSKLESREMKVPSFGPHLDRLSTERGPILQKVGKKRAFRYRFKNPLMQPYVLMRGIEQGKIGYDDLTA